MSDYKTLKKAKTREDEYLDKKMFITRREMMDEAQDIAQDLAADLMKPAVNDASNNMMALYDGIVKVTLVRLGNSQSDLVRFHEECRKIEDEFRSAMKDKRMLSKLCTLYDLDSEHIFNIKPWQLDYFMDGAPIIEVYDEPDQKWLATAKAWKCPCCGRKTVIREMYCPSCGTRLR